MAQRASNYPVFINCAGTTTNPTAASSVLATTGAVTSGLTGAYTLTGGGIYEVQVSVSSSVDATFKVQRRDAGDANTVGSVPIIRVVAKGCVTVPYRFELLAGERVRVMPNADITGDAEATIVAQRVA
jgi:hypothetical protein